MGLTDKDLEKISIAIGEQIREQFGLKPNAVAEMSHFWGMMGDVSDGDAAKSVERLRRMLTTQKRIEVGFSKAMMIIVALITTAAAYGAWEGIKSAWMFVTGRAGG